MLVKYISSSNHLQKSISLWETPILQTGSDFNLTAQFAVVPALLFQLCGAVDLPSSMQSTWCAAALLGASSSALAYRSLVQ